MVSEHTKKAGIDTLVNVLVLFFFIVVLVVGFNIYGDYSVNVDEVTQRKHALINYVFINEEVLGRNMDKLRWTDAWINEDINELTGEQGEGLRNYRSRSYGVALQLPTVLIEDINDFQFTSQQLYQMRHIYNFIIYFCGLVALFFLLKELIKSKLIALAGTALFYLFPHFFASSYYNVKDMLFIPMFIFSCLFMVRILTKKRRLRDVLLFVFFTALASNIRIYGIMPLAGVVVCMIVEDILRWRSQNVQIQQALELKKQPVWRHMLTYFILIFGFLGFWLLIAPAAWINPLDYVQQVLSKAASFDMWESTMLFAGQNLGAGEVPWYYLPLWMGITIPLFDLILFFVGCAFLVATLFRSKRGEAFVQNRLMWIFFFMFFILFFAQIFLKITIYLSWRHMYILFVPMMVLASYGIKMLHETLSGKGGKVSRIVVPLFTIAAIGIGAGRVAANHPYQYSMFNIIGIPVADQFDRDYYRMSAKQSIEWLLQEFPGRTLHIASDVYLEKPLESFSAEQQQRVWLRNPRPNKETFYPAEFYIELFRFTPGNDSPKLQDGYTEIHAIWVDGVKIASVLRNNLFQKFDETGIYSIPLWYFDTIEGVGLPSADGASITSTGVPGYLIYGNYSRLDKGKYIVSMHMKLNDSAGQVPVATMDVAKDFGATVLTSQPIYASDFDENGETTLLMTFTLGAPVDTIELRVEVGEGVRMMLDNVTLYRK